MCLCKLSAVKMLEKIYNEEVSVFEIIESVFDEIEKKENYLQAFISFQKPMAFEKAKKIDSLSLAEKRKLPLAGIPIALSDDICTKNITTTAGSQMLKNFVPSYNATIIEKLETAGAIIIGKTNLAEFSSGFNKEAQIFKITKTPNDIGLFSNGASVAVQHYLPLAVCSDVSGEARLAAACANMVGVRPSFCTVSRNGIISGASGLVQASPIAKTVQDAALLYSVISGEDKADSICKKTSFEFKNACLKTDLNKLKIGLPKEYFINSNSKIEKKSIKECFEIFTKSGVELIDISLPMTKYASAVSFAISCAQMSSNLAKFDGVKYGYAAKNASSLEDFYIKTRSEGFGDTTKQNILLGTALLTIDYSKQYKNALLGRQRIVNEFEKAFEQCDVLLTPTINYAKNNMCDDFSSESINYYTAAASLAGFPAISLPCGVSGYEAHPQQQAFGASAPDTSSYAPRDGAFNLLRGNKKLFNMQIIAPKYSEINLFNIANILFKGVLS